MDLHSSELSETDRAKAMLAQWQGADVEVWEYTVSHKVLTLRLTSSKQPGENLHLKCGACRRMDLPVGWGNSHLVISEDRSRLEALGRLEIVVEDAVAAVRIVCGAVLVDENVEPRY